MAMLRSPEMRARNRKMFGVLMGTLQRARKQVDESEACLQQQQKLAKVDDKLRSDRQRLAEEQRGLVGDRKSAEVARRDALVETTVFGAAPLSPDALRERR